MNVEERIKKIKLVCMDVDGVLTDARIVISSDGTELKFFNVQDGHGIKLASRAGYTMAIITGRHSNIVNLRAAELGIDIVHQNAKNKLPVFEEILLSLNIQPEESLYMGDDLIDIPVMRQAGIAVAPANAVSEVKAIADHVTEKPGGQGAVREALEWLLKTAGHWEKVTARYFE